MQSLQWYLNRARAMPADELATRAWRQLRFGAERLGLVREGDAASAEWPPHGGIENLPPPAVDPRPYVAVADDVRRGTYTFFGRTFSLGFPPKWNTDPLTGTEAPLKYGKTLDHRDPGIVGDAKHLWELNRHLELVPLAQAYRLTGDRAHIDALRELLSSWFRQCPYLRGANWNSSLELGIRLINWHLAYAICGGSASPLFDGVEGRRFRDEWLRSIYRHNRFIMGHLSTYASSSNNHLIGEAAGVFVACCTWPCWPESRKWRDDAQAILAREIRRQVYPDGVDKEQTTWYQQFVASLFLVAGLAGRRAGVAFAPDYWRALGRMIEFVSAMLDVGGNMPMIGDADDGLAFALEPRQALDPFRSLLGVGASLFDDDLWRSQAQGHMATAEWLCAGLEPLGAVAPETSYRRPDRFAFPDGGYYVLGRDLGTPNEVRAVVDAGPLGFLSIAGHGHADCLSVLLSVAGREQLVDPGTYAYHSDAVWRDYFRGTAAHNTARVDGEDQSVIGGPFLWLERAEAKVERFERTDEHDLVVASHDGYLRLADPVRHSRQVRFVKADDVLEIVDRLEGRGRHRVERFWHFAETCTVTLDGRTAVSTDGAVEVRIDVDEADARAELLSGSESPRGGWISRGFCRKAPSTTLVYTSEATGGTELRTRIAVRILRPPGSPVG